MLTFDDIDLLPSIQKALGEIGFTHPTEIQECAIPPLLEDRSDFIGLARTGTGKTAAFGLPLLNQTDIKSKHVQSVVIAPTRELVQQIAKELKNFSKYVRRLKITAVYGGASIVNQMKEIRRENPQIIVATPGRLIDLAGRKALKLGQIDTVVLDEADEMLNMGFQEDIDKILEYTPEDKQIWLFSATMPAYIRKITKSYMTDPIEVNIQSEQKTNENIHHQFAVVKRKDKLDALRRIVDAAPDLYAVVFCRTRRDTMDLSDRLNKQGYAVDALHGELSQSQRDAVMARFRSRKNQMLMATDVAARGIDIDDITHVIHMELPDTIEYYTHRSGRTARAGKEGISLAFITNRDFRKINHLEKQLSIKMQKVSLPSIEDVMEVRIEKWISKIKGAPVDHAALGFFNEIAPHFEDVTKEQLLLKLLSKELKTIKTSDIRDFKELDRPRDKKGGKKTTPKHKKREKNKSSKPISKSKSQGKFTEIFINIGKIDFVNKGELISMLCKRSGLSSNDIGKIEISKRHSTFQLDNHYADQLGKYFKPFKHKGRQIRINPA